MLFIRNFQKNFNKGDLRKPLILNQKYGLGIDYFDLEQNVTYPSLSSVVIKSITEKNLFLKKCD